MNWQPKSSQDGFKWIIRTIAALFALILLYSVSPLNKPAPEQALTIADFFNADGSSIALEQKIKSEMNDPESYEHIKTTRNVEGSSIVVDTRFRGNNLFGAKVIKSAHAIISKEDGQVIEWNMDK